MNRYFYSNSHTCASRYMLSDSAKTDRRNAKYFAEMPIIKYEEILLNTNGYVNTRDTHEIHTLHL